MSVLSDQDIRWRVHNEGMIDNFIDRQVKEVHIPTFPVPYKVISYGTSSYGYDMRVGYNFKVFTNLRSRIIDPKNFDESCFEDFNLEEGAPDQQVIIPPNSFALASSIERFKIPRDVVCICIGKSTYARCGIIANVTPLEPEWEGNVTIEISNTAPLPAIVYAGEGLVQVLFLSNSMGTADLNQDGHLTHLTTSLGYGTFCKESYADKKGKYQNQADITLPRV